MHLTFVYMYCIRKSQSIQYLWYIEYKYPVYVKQTPVQRLFVVACIDKEINPIIHSYTLRYMNQWMHELMGYIRCLWWLHVGEVGDFMAAKLSLTTTGRVQCPFSEDIYLSLANAKWCVCLGGKVFYNCFLYRLRWYQLEDNDCQEKG